MLSILELKLELEAIISGWWTGLLGTAIARVEHFVVTKGKEWQQNARLLCGVWVALKLYPAAPGGGSDCFTRRVPVNQLGEATRQRGRGTIEGEREFNHTR